MTIFYFLQEYQAIILLAFIGGYTDAVGYVKFAGIFTASITGNIVTACVAIYAPNAGGLARFLVTISFVIGGVIGFSLNAKLKQDANWESNRVGLILYSLEIVGFAVTIAIGLTFALIIDGHPDDLRDWRLVLAACILGGTMGVHNAAARATILNVLPTTVMTSTLVVESKYIGESFVFYVYQPLLTPHNVPNRSEFFSEWLKITRPLAAFTIGALTGTVLVYQISYYSLFLPTFLLLLLLIDVMLNVFIGIEKEEEEEESEPGVTREERDEETGGIPETESKNADFLLPEDILRPETTLTSSYYH